ncbi:MAG: DUF1707 SHOCT-like domain-containing protein [Pseudonocardiaceae bacterium]
MGDETVRQEVATMDIVEDQTPRDELRAADADRERVAEQLRSAHAEGRLDLAEYDDRVQHAWAARTYGELDLLTVDLPGRAELSQRRPQPAPPASHEHGRPQHRHGHAAVGAWLSASVINLVIWAIVCLTTMSWIHPWWIWVAGPWGAVLLIRWISARGEGARWSW